MQRNEVDIAILSLRYSFCLLNNKSRDKKTVTGIVKKLISKGIIAIKFNQSIDKLNGSGSCPYIGSLPKLNKPISASSVQHVMETTGM